MRSRQRPSALTSEVATQEPEEKEGTLMEALLQGMPELQQGMTQGQFVREFRE